MFESAIAAPSLSRPRGKPMPWLEPAVATGSLAPVVSLGAQAIRGELGANPIATALDQLGLVALVFLIASLACTPFRIVTGEAWPLRLRRQLGLFAFFYAALHVLTYAGLDQFFRFRAIGADVVKRPFIFAGFLAFVLLVPLAMTSTTESIRRLGTAKWKRLHRLAYVAAAVAVVHFLWRVKKDATVPQIYGAVLLTLFAVRLIDRQRKVRAAKVPK